jgi:hypothetical protein
MSERDPVDVDAEREAEAAAAEAGSIGGRAPEDQDPAERPVSEAGGGESEGFELAEKDLIEQAGHGDGGPSPTLAAFPAEAESDAETAESGEADSEVKPDA